MFGLNETEEQKAAKQAARAEAEAEQARAAEAAKTEQAIRAEQEAAAAEAEAEEKRRVALEAEKTVKIKIRGMKNGDRIQYACAGLHLAAEHRDLLPQTFKNDNLGRSRPQAKRKMVPGEIYELPLSVAKQYLDAAPDALEMVL